MNFTAHINIMPKKELLDPQGKAVLNGLHKLNFAEAKDVRVGKHVTIQIEAGTEEEARIKTEDACKKLLANAIMETYSFTLSKN